MFHSLSLDLALSLVSNADLNIPVNKIKHFIRNVNDLIRK